MEKKRLQLTGGARIGWVDTTWPLATLTVTPELLTLDSHIMGVFHFFSADIVSLEACTFIPFIARGVRIHHRNSKYNSKIVFWVFRNPIRVIDQIEELGFWKRDEDS